MERFEGQEEEETDDDRNKEVQVEQIDIAFKDCSAWSCSALSFSLKITSDDIIQAAADHAELAGFLVDSRLRETTRAKAEVLFKRKRAKSKPSRRKKTRNFQERKEQQWKEERKQ